MLDPDAYGWGGGGGGGGGIGGGGGGGGGGQHWPGFGPWSVNATI